MSVIIYLGNHFSIKYKICVYYFAYTAVRAGFISHPHPLSHPPYPANERGAGPPTERGEGLFHDCHTDCYITQDNIDVSIIVKVPMATNYIIKNYLSKSSEISLQVPE